MNEKCSLCSWPRVVGEFDCCCDFHQRVMRWWADCYSSDAYLMEGRRDLAALCTIRDRIRHRVWWAVETFYALRYGGPFDFWPWDALTRFVCRVRDHEPRAVAYAFDEDDRTRWYLCVCDRCGGKASMQDGYASRRHFRELVNWNSIYCGFTALTNERLIR